jgi:CRISPR-associated protein Cas1
MQQILNTLYVMMPRSYAHLDNDTVRIDVEHETKLRVPLHHLGSIVCFGNVMLSPALIHRCADNGISIVLLDDHGQFKARIEGPISGNILLRQAQHHAAGNPPLAMGIARAVVAGKIRNCRQVLLRGAREAEDESDRTTLSRTADGLAASVKNAASTSTLDALRGIEGEAARNYFGALNFLLRRSLRDDFAIDGRSRRPPRDRLNALMSFLYALLMNDCRSACESVGLDPQLGSLHAVRPGRAALALDLMEEFRSFVGDRLAMTLVNRGQITTKDFETREGGAVSLSTETRKLVAIAYQERKRDEVMHPLLERKVPIGLLPFLQARFVARTIRQEMEGYLPFLIR